MELLEGAKKLARMPAGDVSDNLFVDKRLRRKHAAFDAVRAPQKK
jgi:hypothetical protein